MHTCPPPIFEKDSATHGPIGSDVVETVTFETDTTETWLKLRDRDFIKKSETETRDLTFETEAETRYSTFVYFIAFVFNVVITSKLIFFKFLAFFRPVFVVSYLQKQQTKNRWNIEILLNHFFAIFKLARPAAFETQTETRPKTFETKTRKNGTRDESRDRDQVSRLHHCLLVALVRVSELQGKLLQTGSQSDLFKRIL